MHDRTAIRAAVRAALTGSTDAGSNIVGMGPHATPTLPMLRVATTGERLTLNAADFQDRLLTIAVTIFARAPSDGDIEDVLDGLQAQVEVAMLADDTLGGLTVEMRLETEDRDTGDAKADRTGVSRLVFVALYRTRVGSPSADA